MDHQKGLDLEAWFKRNGGHLHPSVYIAYDATGYSLRMRPATSTPPLPPFDIVTVPLSLTLSVVDVGWADWPDEFLTRFQASPEVLTRFLLMHEWVKGGDSFWSPYLRILPQPPVNGGKSRGIEGLPVGNFGPAEEQSLTGFSDHTWADDVPDRHRLHMPYWYDQDDARWVKGTNLWAAAIKTEHAWFADFVAAMDILKRHACHLGSVGKQGWTLYKWAATILSSRSFGSNIFAGSCALVSGRPSGRSSSVLSWHFDRATQFPVLVPIADLANHDSSAHVTYKSDGATSFTLETNKLVLPNAEVYSNYGSDKRVEEIMLGYGFRPRGVDHDFVALKITVPPALGASGATSQQTSQVFHLGPDGFDGVPQNLVDLLSGLVAIDRETVTQNPPPRCRKGISLQNTRNHAAVASQLRLVLHRQLKQIERHGAGLSTPNVQKPRQIDAFLYRVNQRWILNGVLTSTDNHLNGLRKAGRLVSLDDVLLRASPERLRTVFRGAVRAAWGTRQADKLHSLGVADAVWTLWICTAWRLQRDMIQDNADLDVQAEAAAVSRTANDLEVLVKCRRIEGLCAWIAYMESIYGLPPGTEESMPRRSVPEQQFNTSWSQHGPIERPSDEAESYMAVIQAAVAQDPNGVYADPRWTPAFLQWGLRIWREEAVRVPKELKEPNPRPMHASGISASSGASNRLSVSETPPGVPEGHVPSVSLAETPPPQHHEAARSMRESVSSFEPGEDAIAIQKRLMRQRREAMMKRQKVQEKEIAETKKRIWSRMENAGLLQGPAEKAPVKGASEAADSVASSSVEPANVEDELMLFLEEGSRCS